MKSKTIKKVIFGLLAVTTVILNGAEYIVPPEYDNTVMGVESRTLGLIHNGLTTLSATSKTLGGQTVRFKCFPITKINCRGATAIASAVVSEVSLKEPTRNELVINYGTDTLVEDAGANWRVCGAAVGGITWDTSEMNSSTDAVTGETTITYNYVPNTTQEIYYFFTNNANIGGTSSFMVLDVKQTCR